MKTIELSLEEVHRLVREDLQESYKENLEDPCFLEILNALEVVLEYYMKPTEYWDNQRTFEFYEEDKKAEKQFWKLHHKKWTWAMNEMIWAFTQIRDGDGDDKFFKDNILVDKEGLSEYHKRIENGTRLFGKYYRGLWD